MLIPNHPHDERLSALASGDPDALADAALSEHVASCIRCTNTVAELSALRASLAELPDLRPNRPLRLLPPVEDAAPAHADGVGGRARRFFAPMLTAGAAIAMVGLVGTVAPSLGGMGASAGQDAGAVQEAAPEASDGDRTVAGEAEASEEPNAATYGGTDDEEPSELEPLQTDGQAPAGNAGGDNERLALADEDRPVWPMLLFAGVAIMIAAAMLRWILAPRAG